MADTKQYVAQEQEKGSEMISEDFMCAIVENTLG